MNAPKPPVQLARVRGDVPLYRGMKAWLGFVIVQRGWVEISVANRERKHQIEGSAFFIWPGEIYREWRRSPDANLDVAILSDEAAAAFTNRSPDEIPQTSVVARIVATVRAHGDTLELDTLLAEASDLIDSSAYRHPSNDRIAVLKARHLLLERFRENIRLDELAKYTKLDKFRLIRAFRARYGVPPYEYLTQKRVLEARQLLKAGVSPAQVAVDVGYCDQSQLHRHFVRIVGTTPGRYRGCPG